MRSSFSAIDSSQPSISNEVRLRPYSRLTVSRLIGIGNICPSTLASTRCWYGRHSVNCERYSKMSAELVWKMCGP